MNKAYHMSFRSMKKSMTLTDLNGQKAYALCNHRLPKSDFLGPQRSAHVSSTCLLVIVCVVRLSVQHACFID